MTNRVDFTSKTKKLLAEQAGHRCSKCEVLTVGRHPTNGDLSYSKGRAAHIIAASPFGPRPNTENLSAEQLADHKNGIHLCIECADLIDANRGIDYSPEYLRQLKHQRLASAEAEAEAKYGSSAVNTIVGTFNVSGVRNVTGAEISQPTRIQAGTVFNVSGEENVVGLKIGR